MNSESKIPEQISVLLEKFLENSTYADFAIEMKLKKNWTSLVGERISEIARIVEVKPPFLKIQIEIPTWKMELSHEKDKIIDKVNNFLGAGVIEELVII